jgi:APA family basic amino acid/polyamine antiporter
VDVFNVIILLGTMTGVVPYAFCTAALLQLLAVRTSEFSPRSRPQLIAVGSLGFLYSLWALYGTGEQAIFWGFLVFMAGIPMYTWRQWRNRQQGLPVAEID